MHDEFEEAWTKREEARKAVHGTLAGGSAFRALRKACRKLRETIQAAEYRYLQVYACELEGFIAAGDLTLLALDYSPSDRPDCHKNSLRFTKIKFQEKK